MSIKPYRWLAVLFFMALAGCYPKGPEYIEELDLVYTSFDNQFNFPGQSTYAIPDSVILISGDALNDPDGDGKPQFMNPASAAVVLDQIKKNMSDAGWTKVSKNGNPDVLLLVSAMTTTNIYYYYDWWYWNWWYGGYWGWYYPCCYYPMSVTGYRSGSIFIQMLNIKGMPSGEHLPVVWLGIFNGLAEGGTSNIATRAQRAIDQAFNQSPYLTIK